MIRSLASGLVSDPFAVGNGGATTAVRVNGSATVVAVVIRSAASVARDRVGPQGAVADEASSPELATALFGRHQHLILVVFVDAADVVDPTPVASVEGSGLGCHCHHHHRRC